MATLQSYDLNGKKLSFANWISNITPTDTPFVSMTKKESVAQTSFSWQTDILAKAAKNAQIEGSSAVAAVAVPTVEISNVTQILRKAVQVTDSANALDNYGRTKELQYQMEKAGAEIKRDLELALLTSSSKVDGASDTARETNGFAGLVAAKGAKQPGTDAIVQASAAVGLSEEELFKLTYNLYLAGSKADIIMYHPSNASFFASLMETPSVGGGTRTRMFDGSDTKLNVYTSSLIDPLGQQFQLIPNRFMPEKAIYIFNASDWTQMVLREPSRIKLAKKGSSEKWMIEMEVGLRHRNPFASGILNIT